MTAQTKNNKHKAIAVLIWSLATTFYLYENLLQVSQGVIVPELMREFKLNALELSTKLGSIFLGSYSLFQFPVGIMLDRYNTRILLPIAAFICTLSCYTYAHSVTVFAAFSSRFFMGIGASFAALSCLKLASGWFEHKYFALLTGLMLSIGLTGSIIGEGPLLSLVNEHGWRDSLTYIAQCGLLLTILLLAFIKDADKKKDSKQSIKQTHLDLKQLLKNRQVWAISLYGMLMFTPFLILSNLWGPTFLAQTYMLDRKVAVDIFGMIFLGFIIGGPLFGFFSDYILSRKKPLMIASSGAAVTITLILFCKINSLLYISSLVFLLGFFTSGFLPAFSIMKEINKPQVTTAALGFMNTLNMLGGPVLISLTGFLLEYFWDGATNAGVRVYSDSNFILSFSMLPFLYILAIFILCNIKETHCKNSYPSE